MQSNAMSKHERVLLVAARKATLARTAQRIAAAGGEAVLVTSIGEARSIAGTFDRGIFSFELLDGSGIVLAAEMMADSRMASIEFVHPADELVSDEHPRGMRSTAGSALAEQVARDVA
ncbi:MAG TPA: hypothetical protein VHE30_18905 [Polyangiaceae bacterium]|nr:hypothetical protein [Polyangiaceae bacterium]